MNRWQRNHFKLMTLLEWREDRLSNAVERLLLRIGRKYRKADYVPTVRQMVTQMEPLDPMIRNLVQVAGVVGAAESIVKSNYDLRTRWKNYFQHGSLPDRVTLDMIVHYLEAVGVDRGALAEQMEAHTRRMSDTIAVLAEKKIRQNIVEATSQKWTLKRSMDQMRRTFDGLKTKDVESVMPNVATVVRTESMTVLHASSWHNCQNTPALRSMLWGFEYWAVGDARTRPTHDAQDDVTAEVDSPFWNHWYPPNGYNCRCSVIPLYEEPTHRKEPRWDLHPDKGFDFNPGKNGPFFTPVPRSNTIPVPEPERQLATAAVSTTAQEPVHYDTSVPQAESAWVTNIPTAIPIPETIRVPVVVEPERILENHPVPTPVSPVPKKPLPTKPTAPKPEQKTVVRLATPPKPVPAVPSMERMTVQDTSEVLMMVYNRFGGETVKRLAIVPTDSGCSVYWDGVFVASVEFVADGNGIQLSLEWVRWFKVALQNIHKTFYSLMDSVAWIVEQEVVEKKKPKDEKIRLRKRKREAHILSAKLIQGEHTIEQDLEKTNPGFSLDNPMRNYNCQRCVVAYEMRRRGIDVEAKPITINSDGEPIPNDDMAQMDSPNGLLSVFQDSKWISCLSFTGGGNKKIIESQMRKWGDGSRAIVMVHKTGLFKSFGHVFIVENRDGKIIFIDPQTNNTNASDLLHKRNPFKTRIMRIDNLPITKSAKKCCEARSEK